MNSRTFETDQTESARQRRETHRSDTAMGFMDAHHRTSRPSGMGGRQDELKATTRNVVQQRLTPLSVRAPRWPLPDCTIEHLVNAVSREIERRYGGNDVVNRLEAEALVNHILDEEYHRQRADGKRLPPSAPAQ